VNQVSSQRRPPVVLALDRHDTAPAKERSPPPALRKGDGLRIRLRVGLQKSVNFAQDVGVDIVIVGDV
jgi:hypothetical protein